MAKRFDADLHQFLVGGLDRNNPVPLDLVRQRRFRVLLDHHYAHAGIGAEQLLADKRVGEGGFAGADRAGDNGISERHGQRTDHRHGFGRNAFRSRLIVQT
ncbi:hypothetical protein D3C71_1433940 [compost metagenome]